ncbi:hypothetical protein [Treponema sp. Marseille-Q4523]|uniref:hypothetical protein n=1 Tax=Treponema sp. Marseille-Q4523 TaxID=2810610 RepID=UPI001960383C|nr:hypothetical protein [Treponema sp. Marseille-Q4523]MBM7022002.1 hypothetical protein [Treponema sp. Marseille-Q4523]
MKRAECSSIKYVLRIGIAAACICVFASCASAPKGDAEALIHTDSRPHAVKKKKYNEARFYKALDDGDFESATAFLLGQKITNRERIRQYLDLAFAEHFGKVYDSSIEVCNKVDALMEDAVTKSVTRTVLSATLNENASEYSGRVYEYLYVNLFNALNYYHRGDMEGALVEIRKIGNKQREYIAKYGKAVLAKDAPQKREITDADYAAAMFGINMPALIAKSPPQATKDDVFRDSAASRYVSMLFRLMNGDADDARIDADVIAMLSPRFPAAQMLAIPEGKGRLDVLAFYGLIGRRYEQSFYFPGDVVNGLAGLNFSVIGIGSSAMIVMPPFPNGVVIPAFRLKFVYPAFDASSIRQHIAGVRILVSDVNASGILTEGKGEAAAVCDLSLLEDFNDAVDKDVRTHAAKAFARSVVRSLLKKSAAVTAGEATLAALADKNSNKKSFADALLYELAYLSVSAAIDAVDAAETADVRQSVCLPARAYAGGCAVDPGSYDVTVQYVDASSNIVFQERFASVKVESGVPVLIESSYMKK